MAMDASLHAASVRGTRAIAMREFAAGFMTTSLAPDELLTEVRIQPWPRGHGWAFLEFARRHGDFAMVSVAVLLSQDRAGRVTRASITLGGVGMAPMRIEPAERALQGASIDSRAIADAAAACGEIDALDDIHAPAWYRRRLARSLSARAIALALERCKAHD